MSYAPFRSEPNYQSPNFEAPVSVLPTKSSGNSKLAKRKQTRVKTGHRSASTNNYPIIAHCHLCWDWVWQRPQQFLSRLSKEHQVLFVEMLAPDPGLAAPLARFRVAERFPSLTILTLQFPVWRWQDGDYVDAERRRLVKEFLHGPGAGKFENPVQWFYDPMAVRAFAGQMNERVTVYDCMDELSKFACAPPDLIERELELLKRADIVFTGGRKLFEAKSRFHDNCHFYGCGVEWEHFGKARAPETVIPNEIARLPKPRLGYFGVVDERLDYQLLDQLARQNPEASVVMVGPVMKVDARALPQQPNLHWLGKQAYADLPAFAKAFDVCLMPFALNEATEFINPTKALEYMATGRPVVSTAVADVVRNFGSVIQVARSRAEFIECCRKTADQPNQGAVDGGLDLARANSWDRIIGELDRHVVTALRGRASLSKAVSNNGAGATAAGSLSLINAGGACGGV